MSIEVKLKDHILKQYKSIRAFSIEAGIPYSSIDNIFKRGLSGSGIGNVSKICNALGIDIDALEQGEIVLKKEKPTDENGEQFDDEVISMLKEWKELDKKQQDLVAQQIRILWESKHKKPNE